MVRINRRLASAVTATVVAGATLAAVTGVGVTGTAAASSTSVIKFAESPGASPNYIFPETTDAQQSLYNIDQFINLMYPLVYLPNPNSPTLDYKDSMAYPPTWSDNDTVVTLKLKNYKWSDGTPVTARDLIFYINLGKAEGATWGNYSGPANFPYNLKSYTAVNATTAKFVLKSSINPTYFDDNGLDYITPIPQQAWDKESLNGPIGNYDMTAAGAKKVVAFLQKEAADQNAYTTNPLWKVVDGPWTLKTYGGTSSPDIFVPNPSYSGPKPSVAEFEEIPFTTSSAEFTALKDGGILDYGLVPTEDIPAMGSVKAEGYVTTEVPDWGFDYMIPNLVNPQVGPILKQLYIRQALETLMDQQTMIKSFMSGYGVPTYGPTPVYPKGNPFVSPAEKHNPYPYSVSNAEALLKKHDWQINPGKADVCEKAGPAGCGAGITKGEKLSLNLLWASGLVISQEENDLFVSDASKAGVQINARSADFNSVYSTTVPCILPKNKGTATCNWQLGEYGGLGLSTYPSGEGVFNTGGAFNAGQYSNPTLDKYIAESTTAKNLNAYYDYENLVVKDVPWIWMPVPDNIWATIKGLSGFGMVGEFTGAFDYIEPQFWHLS